MYIALVTNVSRSTFKICKNYQISAKWTLAETVNEKRRIVIFMLYYLISITLVTITSMNIGWGGGVKMDNAFSTLMSDRNPAYYMKDLGLHSREIEFNQNKYLI